MKAIRVVANILVHLILFVLAIDAIWGLSLVATGASALIYPHPLLDQISSLLPPALELHGTQTRIYWIIALLLVVLYWVATFAMWTRRPRALRVRTKEGETLLIHAGALVSFAHAQIEGHPAVSNYKIKVKQVGGRALAIRARVDVRPIDSLPNIKREIESALRDGFAQVLGIEKIDEITLILGLDKKHLERRPGPAASAGPPRPRPEPPVKGPLERYDPDGSLGLNIAHDEASTRGDDEVATSAVSTEVK